jgi:hypothetical protein
VIPDHANDRITVSNAGPRLVTASFSVFGTAGRNVQLRLRKNDVEVAGLGCRLKFDGSGNLESASFAGIVDCDQSDVLTVWAEADVNGTSLTIVDAALTVSRAD